MMGWTDQNVIANRVIIEGANGLLLVYSGAPALGNLIASTAGANGADAFGNQYLVGETVYGVFSGTYVALQMQAGQLFVLQASAPGGPYLQVSSIGNIAAGSIVGKLLIQALSHTYVHLIGNSVLIGGTTGTSPVTAALLEVQGAAAVETTVNAIVSGAAETWHAMSGGLAAGFAVGSFISPRYQYLATGSGGRVALSGAVNLTANQTAGTTFFTLPAGYRPAGQQFLQCQTNLSGLTLGQVPITVTTGGAIQLQVSGTSGNFVTMDGVTFELD